IRRNGSSRCGNRAARSVRRRPSRGPRPRKARRNLRISEAATRFIPGTSVRGVGPMTRCPECGWEIDPEDEMCPNCGAYLADYEDVEPCEDGGPHRRNMSRAAPLTTSPNPPLG